LVYTGIALAGTMVMATSDRRGELALLRLAGATRRQVLLLVAVEALSRGNGPSSGRRASRLRPVEGRRGRFPTGSLTRVG
jgi:FtsX-like permease family protein